MRMAGGSPDDLNVWGVSDGIALMSWSPVRPVQDSSLSNAASFKVSTSSSVGANEGRRPSRLANVRRSIPLTRTTLAR